MDSPKPSRSNRPAVGDSPPVQDSPFSLFASSLSPIPLNALSSSSFVTFPSPEPVFASPQVHQPRKLLQLRRSEHQLFPCSNKDQNPEMKSGKVEITKLPLEIKSVDQEQPCSSSSVSIDTFLIDQSEPSIQNSNSSSLEAQETEKSKTNTHNNNNDQTEIIQIQEINSNSESKIEIEIPPVKIDKDISPINTPKLTGIGLHLNSLTGAITPLTNKSDQTHLVHGGPGLINSNRNNLDENISSPLLAKILDPFLTPLDGKKLLLLEDSSSVKTEENVRNSPKRKRKKNGGEEGHKSCNCKRSKCLKLYCECFLSGTYCNSTCACHDCSNKPSEEHLVKEVRKTIESRNPLAFVPRVVVRLTQQTEENSEVTPPSTRHKRGCNCKKSRCLKKYCECFQSGVACFLGCRCENCLNKYGTKDGSEIMEPEQHKKLHDGSETDPLEGARSKSMMIRSVELNNLPKLPPLTPSLQPSMSQISGSSYSTSPTSSLPILPLQYHSSPISIPSYPFPQSPLFSPQSSNPYPSTPLSHLEGKKVISQTHSTNYSPNEGKKGILQSGDYSPDDILEGKSGIMQIGGGDYSPDILEEFHMRMGVVKSISPKKKRVEFDSPRVGPQGTGGLRSGRKFILQSVPSLPSFSPYRNDNNNHNSNNNDGNGNT